MNPLFRKGTGAPWRAALPALLELILGFVLLGFPLLLGEAAVWAGGFFVIALAFVRLIEGIRRERQRLWNLLAALVYALLGGFMIARTDASLAVWTLAIGLALIAAGVFRFALAVALRDSPGAAWRFFSAAVSLALGAMVAAGWPASSQWFLGTVIAVEMIFSGWTLLFIALAPRPGSPEEARNDAP